MLMPFSGDHQHQISTLALVLTTPEKGCLCTKTPRHRDVTNRASELGASMYSLSHTYHTGRRHTHHKSRHVSFLSLFLAPHTKSVVASSFFLFLSLLCALISILPPKHIANTVPHIHTCTRARKWVRFWWLVGWNFLKSPRLTFYLFGGVFRLIPPRFLPPFPLWGCLYHDVHWVFRKDGGY